MEVLNNPKSNITRALLTFLVLLSVFFAVRIVSEVKGFKLLDNNYNNTISVNGQGEVLANPDVAMIYFSIVEKATTLAEAQSKATAKEKAALDFLAKEEIAKKDIKTEAYNTYPNYEYENCNYQYPCPARSPKIVGYEVSERISVKIRNVDKSGAVVTGLGTAGISEISKPEFTIDDTDKLKAEARKLAIDEARAKAKVLANDLGVDLGKVVSFYDERDYIPPMYGGMGLMEAKADMAMSAPAPELPTGENKITSSVTITYEIR
ncbi:MAG: SIMPL domain-containing protein [Candidatus Paceibacterota bacterium]|jgi:hypothetical protein